MEEQNFVFILPGMWYGILNLVNFIGVLTNAFIIAFTSDWGSQFSTTGKLWVVIGFEVSGSLLLVPL